VNWLYILVAFRDLLDELFGKEMDMRGSEREG
jgi:hypothetical protein